MSTQSRQKIISAALVQGQRTGNLNILLTNAIAQQVGMSATDFECYSLLKERGTMTAGELAQACGISTGGLTGLVDRLSKLNLVERVADPNDRRKVLVQAKNNKAVQAKIDELTKPMIRGFMALNELYTDDELALLLLHSTRVNDVMQSCLQELSKK